MSQAIMDGFLSAVVDVDLDNLKESEKREPSENLLKTKEDMTSVLNEKAGSDMIDVMEELGKKTDTYTTTVGSYCEWKTVVDLGPPVPGTPVPPEDVHISNYYNALQYTLYETGYPETEDRCKTPIRDSVKDKVTIAILSSPVECMGMLLEGGRQCPNDMLLIMSVSWLSKRKSEVKEGLFSLYAHKGISVDVAGHTFLNVYDPPRRVTYFVDFFTRGCTDNTRDDGALLEKDLDCPMSSSIQLCRIMDDKLWTRIQMAEIGMSYPETLAFPYCSTLEYDSDFSMINIVKLDSKVGVENLMLEEIQKFIHAPYMQAHKKVVVKPSGVLWHASVGVTFHPRTDTVAIWEAALELLRSCNEEDCIMIEAFYNTIEPKREPGLKWAATEKHASRVRATVCRGPDNYPHMTKIVCGVGLKKKPVNGDNTIPQSLDTTLIAFNVLSKQERLRVEETIKNTAEDLFERIDLLEKKMSVSAKGTVGAQTDVIGVDLILSEIDDEIVPVGIEVNSHDCTINCHVYEFMYPDSSGEAFRPLMQNMVARSQRYILQGKKMLVIGAGGYSKKFIWEMANEVGIEIYLVDHDPDHFAAAAVAQFITYDLTDHTQDNVHAKNIIALMREKKIAVDGCITFWEDCGPLAAQICEILKFNGVGYEGAMVAKKKSRTQEVVLSKGGDIPHWPRTNLYGAMAYPVDSQEDIENVASKLDFPCVMKLEYGSSAVGVKLVSDILQCYHEFDTVRNDLTTEGDHPGIGLGHGNDMLMMEYIGGTEHDIDIIIYKRKLIAAFVSDNGPTRLPYFTETAAAMPTYLPDDKRRQLIIAAYQCCVEVGLISGVFNVEMKMTTTGPKLIEINARMGGFYLRDWIRAVYCVDILMCAFMIACDIRPFVPNIKPHGQIMGVMIVPSAHRYALQEPSNIKLIKLLEDNNVIRVNRLEEKMGPESEDKYEEPFCNIALMDPDREAIKTKILGVFSLLGLNNPKYPVEEYLKDFRFS